jgi:hypothetical protein
VREKGVVKASPCALAPTPWTYLNHLRHAVQCLSVTDWALMADEIIPDAVTDMRAYDVTVNSLLHVSTVSGETTLQMITGCRTEMIPLQLSATVDWSCMLS